jgi:hypothetical protein
MTINTLAPLFEDETRLRNLSSKAIEGVITDEEFAELMQLSKAKRKVQEDRVTLLAEFKKTFEKHGITIHDLFSASEITSVALPRKQITISEPYAVKARRGRPGVKSDRYRFKDGPVLIEITKPDQRGFPCRYCKGQSLPGYVAKALKELDNGQLEANLANYYTSEGQAYFSTVDGGAELSRLVHYIKTHQVKPHLG